jgi:phosphoglycerol transferase MdoB-like AlkP superfamily enzyme
VKKIFLFLLNLGFLLFSLLLYRLVFLLTYGDRTALGGKDLFPAFLAGLRFDLATSAYVLVPFAVLAFLPYLSGSTRYLRALSVVNVCWLVVLDIYLFVDLLYYPYSLRHLSFELFTTKGDLMSMVRLGVLEYPWQMAIFFFIMAFIVFAYFSFTRRMLGGKDAPPKRSFVGRLLMDGVTILVMAALMVVMARGGVQMKPLKYSDAFAFQSPFLGQLVLNGVYTTMRTYYSFRENKEMKGWERRRATEEEAMRRGTEMVVAPEREESPDPRYPLYRHFRYREADFRRSNVVVFIMESWSSKFVGVLGGEDDAMPYFGKISKKGVLFRNFFSNGQRSIEAISAILTSIPPSGGMILSQSGAFSQMPVKFLPSILKERGYGTFFIHGAKPGSMGFNSLVKQTGIERYISKDEIRSEGGRDDGVWGIYDEDTFLYAHRLFQAQKDPFFAVIFSLSSHTPYKLPSERFRYFKPARPFHDFLDSLRYSDYALSRFFDEAEKSAYFKNTIFIIVGDHTEGKSTGNNLYERFSVPCLIYAPGLLPPSVVSKVAAQTDLSPTILDILKSPDVHTSFGQSAFNDRPGVALLSYGDSDVFVREGWMITSSAGTVREHYRFGAAAQGESPDTETKVAGLAREEDYYVQFFHDLMLGNRLYPARGKDRR